MLPCRHLSYIQHIEGVNTVGSKFAFHSLGFDRRRHFLLSESLMNDIAFVGRGCWRGAMVVDKQLREE